MAEEFNVGHRLREIRQEHGLSQRQLAEIAEVPHGQISMIETNKSSPSVASLRKILGGINMSMSEFFEPEPASTTQIFFTPSERRDLTSRLYQGDAALRQKLTIEQLGDARAHGLQIFHERYEPGADTGASMISHPASEGGFVITGELEVTVGAETRLLKAGDGFLFDSRAPHRFRNISDRVAEVISACTPPYL